MQNILGISLGTRFMGMAVMYDGELTDFRVRTFYKAWTAEKQGEMIQVLRKVVDRYGITRIVVKSPRPSHCSQNIQELLRDIQRVSAERGIQVATCTITVLKQRYMGAGRGNKQALVQAIVQKYPQHRQLAVIAGKKRSHRTLSYVKLFEAIACTELGS
jgi:hypothetical protein